MTEQDRITNNISKTTSVPDRSRGSLVTGVGPGAVPETAYSRLY